MAREYLTAADADNDPQRKSVLLGIAKLYNQTALAMEAAMASPIREAAE